MRRLGKLLALAAIGGLVYVGIEILWRGRSHWSMFLLGGVLFVALGGVNEYLSFDTPLALQAIIGAGIVTAAEFASGIVLNLWLGLGVWDYSTLPLNLLGQICLPYTLLWVPLSVVAIVLDDWLRFWLFGEERPHYVLF